MKKIALVIIGLIISAGLIFGLVKFTKYELKELHGKTYSLDISQFKGKIIPNNGTSITVSTIYVPINEALKSGENAILCYSKRGIKIWNPNPATPGIYTYSEIGAEHRGSTYDKKCEITIKKEQIAVHETPTIFGYVFAIVIFLIILILALAAIFATLGELFE